MLTSDMVTKVFIFLIIFTSSVFAQCKNYSTISNSEIKDLQIKIIKEKAFLRHVSKFYFPTIKSHFPFFSRETEESIILRRRIRLRETMLVY